MKLGTLIVAGAAAIVFGMFVFFRAKLIWARPMQEMPIDPTTFDCHYFTGAKLNKRIYMNEPTGLIGRDTCPRILNP